jgi:hypothetical protein
MRVDRDNRTLYDVSLMTIGEAEGHGEYVDDVTLKTALEAIQGRKIKAILDHDDGVLSNVGIWSNFRIEGDQLKGDIEFYRSKPEADLIIEMAEEAGEEFGVSGTIEKFIETIDGKPRIRVSDVRSFDIVNTPATNPNGLYSKPKNYNQPNTMTEEEIKKVIIDTITEEYKKLNAGIEERIQKLEEKVVIIPEGNDDKTDVNIEEKVKEELSKYSAKLKEEAAQFAKGICENFTKSIPSILGKYAAVGSPNRTEIDEPKDFDAVVAMYQKQGKSKVDAIQAAVVSHPELHAKQYRSASATATV